MGLVWILLCVLGVPFLAVLVFVILFLVEGKVEEMARYALLFIAVSMLALVAMLWLGPIVGSSFSTTNTDAPCMSWACPAPTPAPTPTPPWWQFWGH